MKTYPYTEEENSSNEYQGIECRVVKLQYNGDGAENILALIKVRGHLVWVSFEKLEYQCCAECGH